MNPDDFKKVLDDALEPIKKTQGEQTKKLDAVWEQTTKLTEDLTEVQITQESHTKELKQIAANTEHINDNVEKVDKRLTGVESHIGIVPPPQLTIIR